MGFEPTTFCLGSKHSTTELRPQKSGFPSLKMEKNSKQFYHEAAQGVHGGATGSIGTGTSRVLFRISA